MHSRADGRVGFLMAILRQHPKLRHILMISRTLTLSFLAILCAAPLSAQTLHANDWRTTAFPVMKHDFGVVAVGAKTEFRFPIVNNMTSDMHIRSVRASCGCTTPIVETNLIAPGQQGTILARFNTGTFRGKKGATLTVIIDRPFYSEVRLRVDGYIRSDIVFHPGSIEFSKVNQGDPSSQITKLMYAGRSDWKVVDVKSNYPWLQPSFEQTMRANGRVDYQLVVKVREDAPTGYFQDELTVITSDKNMPKVPLRVSGQVESSLSISPQAFSLGQLKLGQGETVRMAIKGRAPFTIDSITCDGWDVRFDAPQQEKILHIVSATFTPQKPGLQKKQVVIKTSGQSPVSAKAFLTAEVRAE